MASSPLSLVSIHAVGFSVAIAFANCTLAIVIRPDRDDQRYRELAEEFPAVCWIPDDEPGGTDHGTGTLISDRWVLTAAHVVDGGSKAVGNTVVSANRPAPTHVQFGDQFYSIRRIVLHPDSAPTELNESDLALLELDKPVRGIEPIPIYVADREIGQVAHMVGYGFSGTFDTGQPSGDGDLYRATVPTKRAATNEITDIVGRLIITTIDPPGLATVMEGGLGTADSGGPLLILDQRGYAVAGVAHKLYGDEDKFQHVGGQDAYVRVADYARWIEGVTGEDFGAPYQPRDWSIVATVLLIAMGVICLYMWSRWHFRNR